MGRKPNQLILEFFERGPKLEDASNRYQHTCKSCGEKFPKGRIDSLTNHLVKKCPAIAVRDRQRAILQFHELPDLPSDMAQIAAAPNVPTMNLPFAPKQHMSALETLAEVSRQHLDLSGNKRGRGKNQITTPPPLHTETSHGALLDEFLIQDDRSEQGQGSTFPQGLDMSNAPALPSIYQFNGPLSHSPTNSPQLAHHAHSDSSMAQMVPSLVMAASQANELMPLTNGMTMEPELNLSDIGISDKFFHTQGRSQWANLPQSSIDPSLQDHPREPLPTNNQESLQRSINNPRPIAINPTGNTTHFTTDFSVNQKPAKPKVRGRFSDSRRKEVQEVRKRGACIRCRMLKKPCSGDNPCNTCQNVESARLWKQPCIRTRIADEFSLYSAGLHSVLAFHAVSQAKGQIWLDSIPGRIEATHFPESGNFATFTPVKCQAHHAQGSDIDPALMASPTSNTLEIIDTDDDIGGRLDPYIKKVATSLFEAEESGFMKATVRTALNIKSSNQDNLLSKILELWNLTRILTSRTLDWQLYSNPTLAPSAMSSSDPENSIRTPITRANNTSSYELIRLQLMGAVEKSAGALARSVMNDLERRLLQRQQANPFETFLVAVILMACVERMCWLFATWDDQTSPPVDSTRHAPYTNGHPATEIDMASALSASSTSLPDLPPLSPLPSRNPKWPFDKSPAFYSQQGERFSDILFMLLKMRGVPPKPIARGEDRMLIIWGAEVDEAVKEWYEGIAVTESELIARREAVFVGADPSEWALKFVGKIIAG